MLCAVVVFNNCACIWINCSSRLLPETPEAPAKVFAAEVESLLPLLDGAAVVTATDDPSL